MKSTMLTTSEVAALLGVTPTSIKRWTEQNLLPCIRTTGKHRRFLRPDVEKFAAKMYGIVPFGNEIVTLPRPQKAISDEAWVALLTGDRGPHGIRAALLAEREVSGTWWKVAERLRTVLGELGQRWHNQLISVIEEHIASEQFTRALAYFSEQLVVDGDAPKCVLAMAENDDHTLGLVLCELCLREAGWKTQWVGRSTPISEMSKFLSEHSPTMLALSASVSSTEARLAIQANAMMNICRETKTILLLGGYGPWPEVLPSAHRVYSFVQLHDLLKQLGLTKLTT